MGGGMFPARKFVLGWGVLLALGWGLCGTLGAQERPAAALPEGEGKELLSVACTQCHSNQVILMMRDGLPGWRALVEEMVLRGAPLMPEETETLAQYLSRNLGPGMKPMQTGKLPPNSALPDSGGPMDSKQLSLPSGNGKNLVESRCALCHDLGRVVSLRRSKQEWERIVKNMIARGLPASVEQTQTMISYLSAQFGKEAP